MRASEKTAAELRAEGWSPVDILGADSVREAKELVLRYELAGVPLVVTHAHGGYSHEVYAPEWSHDLLRVAGESGPLWTPSVTVVVRGILRAEDPPALAAAVCSALLLGGWESAAALVERRSL